MTQSGLDHCMRGMVCSRPLRRDDRGEAIGEPYIGRRVSDRAKMGDGVGSVGGIPEHDRSADEVKAGGAKLLRLGAGIGNPALFEHAEDLRERMTLTALVAPGVASPA